MSRQSRKWLAAAILVLAIAGGLFTLSVQSGKRADQIRVLQVGDETIYANEAMVYWKLMRSEFERMGGEEIWDLQVLGIDPQQTAMDRVLESIIRIKVIQPLTSSLKDEEVQPLEVQVDALKRLLGDRYMAQHQIDEALLWQITEENYKAYRYEKDAKFLAGSNEEEIAQKQRDAFSIYDMLDQDLYLQVAGIQSIMFYTGQWVEGVWVSYSDVQKALILEEAQKQYETLTPKNFAQAAASYDAAKEENPVLTQGAVQHRRGKYGYIYRGQVEQQAASIIFATPMGEITPIIETEYGYLIVRVVTYAQPSQTDRSEYERQLEAAKEAYRVQLIEELKMERLEEEWQRMEEETRIQRWSEKWQTYIRQGGNEDEV